MKNKVLALDYGTKRIGIAISDELRLLAFSRGIITNSASAIKEIITLIEKENIGTVLLGVPKTLSGGESEMTKEVLKFRNSLASALPNGIELQTRDERLTSLIAETNIRSRQLPKKKREQKSLRDEEAARILLQEYLDSIRK